MKIEFEDDSILEVSEHWIECIQMKYGKTWDEYWSQMKQVIDGLWAKGETWTKFGTEDMKRYYEDEEEGKRELNRAWHAEQCIYADLRACLMEFALKLFSKEGKKIPKVIGIADDEIHVYDGEKMRKYEVEKG